MNLWVLDFLALELQFNWKEKEYIYTEINLEWTWTSIDWQKDVENGNMKKLLQNNSTQ